MRSIVIVMDADTPVREVLDRFDQRTFVTITLHNRVIGVFTDGDLRRHIIDGIDFSKPISHYMNTNFVYASPIESDEAIERLFNDHPRVNVIPVLEGGVLAYFRHREYNVSREPEVTLVVMAGGVGSRLKPLTDILPKALVPIDGRAIIHRIIDKLECSRVRSVLVSTGHMSEYLELYISRHVWSKKIKTFREERPLGTVGVLTVPGLVDTQICVISNCDVLVDIDINHVIDFHLSAGASLTVVAALATVKSPYGVCVINQDGDIIQLDEKPEAVQVVNTGVYVANQSVFNSFPRGERLDMDAVIGDLLSREEVVKIYQISAAQWSDIGQLPDLQTTLNNFKLV